MKKRSLNPFAYLRDFWNKTKPDEPDDTSVPNRAAFRQMGIRGRRGAQLVKQTVGAVGSVDEHEEMRWTGIRLGKFTRPRVGRSLPMMSHRQALMLKTYRRQAGAINNRRWMLDKIERRRQAQGIQPSQVKETP